MTKLAVVTLDPSVSDSRGREIKDWAFSMKGVLAASFNGVEKQLRIQHNNGPHEEAAMAENLARIREVRTIELKN